MKLKAVVLRCVHCRAHKTLPQLPREQPMCDCGMPMVVDKAATKPAQVESQSLPS